MADIYELGTKLTNGYFTENYNIFECSQNFFNILKF